MATIYDSRAFVKRLIEAGMPEGQADTLASENLLLIAEHLATKDDLKPLATNNELRSEIAALRKEMVTKAELNAAVATLRVETATLGAELKSLENRLVVKLGAVIAAMLTIFRLL